MITFTNYLMVDFVPSITDIIYWNISVIILKLPQDVKIAFAFVFVGCSLLLLDALPCEEIVLLDQIQVEILAVVVASTAI